MPTPLYPTFRKRITDAFALLETKQIEPWSLFNSGHPMEVFQHNGKKIHYGGIKFEGSPQTVFWGRYIDPFLENLCVTEVDEAVGKSKERKVDTAALLEEIRPLLISGCTKIFNRMAQIDRNLRGQGYPDRIAMRSVVAETERMKAFISERINAELKMVPPIYSQAVPTMSEISEEGRQSRFAQWAVIGVDRVRADLERGGLEVVGGTEAVRKLAWEWVRLQGQSAASGEPAINNAGIIVITDMIRKEMSAAVSTFKDEIKKLHLSNAASVEVHADFQQIQIELERPEPRRPFLKALWEGARDRLLKYIGEKGMEEIMKELTVLIIRWFT